MVTVVLLNFTKEIDKINNTCRALFFVGELFFQPTWRMA
jgi:hypothetical protein